MILGGTDDSEDYKNEGMGSASTIVPIIDDNFVFGAGDTAIKEEVIDERA